MTKPTTFEEVVTSAAIVDLLALLSECVEGLSLMTCEPEDNKWSERREKLRELTGIVKLLSGME